MSPQEQVDRIKLLAKEKGIKIKFICSQLGLAETYLSNVKNGKDRMTADRLRVIAKLLDTTPAYLSGETDDSSYKDPEDYPTEDIVYFEILGSVAAGYNGHAVEEYTGDKIPFPRSALHNQSPNNFFALRVKGDSMYPQFLDGDTVLVRRCQSVDSGSVAVILYNDEEATVKKVVYVPGEPWLEMIPTNPEYKTKRIEGEELEHCRVLGQVVMLTRTV